MYAMLKLRQDVFIVEQQCAYADIDNIDSSCWHLIATLDGVAIATSRIVPPGIKYEDVSIGRVATAQQVRLKGYGRELMRRSIGHCNALFNFPDVKIGAQKYLKKFYEDFGFSDVNQEYLEDGIPHLIMHRKADSI